MTNSVSPAALEEYAAGTEKRTISAFFSGVGGIELGFKQTGEFRVVYANEFDKNAQITYEENHLEVPLDKRDIHEVQPEDVPDSNIIMGGFPCQAFSIAGYRKGFEDERGDLFFELLRLIKAKQPEAIFVENVKNMVTHDHGNTFKVIREALSINGYHIKWKVLNGKDYGNVPQNRERIYVVGFKNKFAFDRFDFPEPIELTNGLDSIINFNERVEERFFYRRGVQPFYDKLEPVITSKESVYQWRRQYVRENKSGVVPTLTANMGTGGHNVPLIYTDYGIRKLTPREAFNAQGYPNNFILPEEMAVSHLYKQAGNSVVVPVIRRIAENMAKALNETTEHWEELAPAGYAVIHADIEGRYSGASYVEQYLTTAEEADIFKENNTDTIPVISDEEYLKLISKGNSLEFYSIVPV